MLAQTNKGFDGSIKVLHRTAICAWCFALEFLVFISQFVAVGELVRRQRAMSDPNQSKHGNAPRTVTFKRHAHLFTLISTVWTVFTVLAATFFRDNRDHDYGVYLIAIGIWVLHAVWIGLSVYFWKTERESVLMVQHDEDGGD